MRFDLTVPLARFVAQHAGRVGHALQALSYRHRVARQNTQHGRYREFMQCDFDTIGTRSITADIETVLVMHDLLRAIGFEDFKIHINNRQVLRGLLDRAGLTEQSVAVLRAIDKLAKIGPEKVVAEIVATAGASEEQAQQVVQMAELRGPNDQVLARLAPLVAGSEQARPASHGWQSCWGRPRRPASRTSA